MSDATTAPSVKGFVLQHRLGKGGMGEVWLAEQPIVKTKVAIKFLIAEVSSEAAHVQRFFNEAIAVSKIKHAGIAKIYDVGFEGERAFLIMEFLEGETLASRIARTRGIPVSHAAELARQIASILEATHQAQITHRDLKPDNVFVVPDAELAAKERVKILDFGIAKLTTTSTGTGLTMTGGSMGTPAYMAPEQWQDASKAGAPADVYSFGCIAFEMLCGRPPFVVSSIAEACTSHLTKIPPRVRTIAASVPRELDELIAKMLAKDASERPTLAEVARVFAAAAAMPATSAARSVAPASTPASTPALAATLDSPTPAPAAPPPLATTLGESAAEIRPRADAPVVAPITPVAPAERTAPVVEPPTLPYAKVGSGAAVVAVGVALAIYATSGRGKPPVHSVTSSTTSEPSPSVIADAGPPQPTWDASAAPPRPSDRENPWIAITPPPTPIPLGVDDDHAALQHLGFRPSRHIMSPSTAYSIQRHEVTWGELDPWLAAVGRTVTYPPWATDPTARARLPVTGVPFTLAIGYCQARQASLPTEEQFEYAVRGRERRPSSWGSAPLDLARTHAYAGLVAVPAPVETGPQDVTPEGVHDLIGNAQEWTSSRWRDSLPDKDESWVDRGDTLFIAIRGLPLGQPLPPAIQSDPAAYREPLCATGACADKGQDVRQYVGFRCAKEGT